MEFMRNKQKLIQSAKSKGLSLDEYLFNKYNNYKLKYLESKTGGKYQIGTKDSSELLSANLTLVSAHGSIDIETWYALPENVYLMVTSDIGGITCGNYNMVFNKLINDTKSRTNLKSILETRSMSVQLSTENINKHIYEGGHIMYEPGDLIPKINLGYHNNSITNSAKLIYGIFNYKPIIPDNQTKIDILEEYDNLLQTDSKISIERLNKFNIGTKFNKHKLIELIEILKLKHIDFDLAFDEFMVDDKYKKYISQPENLDFDFICDVDDNIFLTMIISLFYKEESKVNIYSNSIKDIIDNLDKSKQNLIVLTSCLHTKNVLMRIFQNKKDIPETLTVYNQTSGESKNAGEYFKNEKLFPNYELLKEEEDNVNLFLQIYKDWNNKRKITRILEEEITLSSLNKHIITIIIDCIENNNYNVINLLRNNGYIDKINVEAIVLRILLSLKIVKTNQALIEFFKFNEFKDPGFNVNHNLLYHAFYIYNKIYLWDALVINKIKWYTYDKYSPETCMSIIIKLISTDYDYSSNEKLTDEDRIRLIKLYFTNSTFSLLNHVLTNIYSIHSSVIANFDQFAQIIINDIYKDNIPDLLVKIGLGNISFFDQMINILFNNKILHKIKQEEITDLLINLIDKQYSVNIDLLNNLINKITKCGFDINIANKHGYNFYSYIVNKHICSLAITKFWKPDDDSQMAYYKNTIQEKEDEQLSINKKMIKLNFLNNGKLIESIPTDFSKYPQYQPFVIDNVKCRNYYG
jgi:hypothetical protein